MSESTIIIDNGSGLIKAGYAEDETPSVIFKPIIGRPEENSGVTDYFIGSEAENNKDTLKLSSPIDRGFVKNWADMNDIWEKMFTNMLGCEASGNNIFVNEKSYNHIINRERIVSNLFEKFDAARVCMSISPVLSLYAVGKFTGIVVDIGEGSTTVSAVIDAKMYSNYPNKFQALAGKEMTDYLCKLLYGHDCSTLSEREHIMRIKEKVCYVAYDYEAELKHAISDPASVSHLLDYTLPDGSLINIGSKAFECPEILFDPSIIGKVYPGIHTLTVDSINFFPPEERKDLYKNIVLSGGTTTCPKLEQRFLKELETLCPCVPGLSVIARPERAHLSWLGASIYASVISKDDKWISKAEFEEYGNSIIGKKLDS